MQSNKAVNADAQVRPRAQRASILVRRLPLLKSKTDWARLKASSTSAAPSAEHPEADIAHVLRGVVPSRACSAW